MRWGGGLGALRKARSPVVTPMLLGLARNRQVVSAVWYGALLDVLGDRRAPAARPLFEKMAKARGVSGHARFMSLVGMAKLGDRDALDGIRERLSASDVMDARIAALALHELIGTPHAMTEKMQRAKGDTELDAMSDAIAEITEWLVAAREVPGGGLVCFYY